MKKKMGIVFIIVGMVFLGTGSILLYTYQNDTVVEVEHSNPSTLTPVEKGQFFEEFIINSFDNKEYALEERVNDQTTREHICERSMYPDLVFRKRSTQHRFAVECKYRSAFNEYKNEASIEWAKERNITNYNKFAREKNIDVVIVIGIGGAPNNPDELYAIPLRALQYPFVKRNYLQRFRLVPKDNRLIFSEQAHNITDTR